MPLQERWLFDLRRAPSGSSLTIGGLAGCSATVLGAGICPGFGARAARVLGRRRACQQQQPVEEPIEDQVEQAQRHAGSCPATGQGRSPPVRSSGRLLEPHKPAGGLRAQEPPPAQGGDGRSDATAIMPDRRSPLVSSVCHVLEPHRLPPPCRSTPRSTSGTPQGERGSFRWGEPSRAGPRSEEPEPFGSSDGVASTVGPSLR